MLCLCAVYVGIYGYITAPRDAGDFLARDYADYISDIHCQSDQIYAPISDVKSAGKIGRKALADRFPASRNGLFRWMVCDVQYNERNDMWYIRANSRFAPELGGDYHVIMRANGTVVAIWGDK